MSNNLFKELVEEETPQFNPEFSNGLATSMVPESMAYIDKRIKNAIEPCVKHGLTYLGCRRLTPLEHYESLFGKNKTTMFDIAKSFTHKVCFAFKYVDPYTEKETIFEKEIFLLYVEDGGVTKISDSSYHIVPVLTDTVISVSYNEIFARLFKDKLTFKRMFRNIKVDGRVFTGQLIYSHMIRTKNKAITKLIGKIEPPTAVYLPIMYGLKDALKKFYEIDEVKVTDQPLSKEDYENYLVYESTGERMVGMKDPNHGLSFIKFLLPKNKRSNKLDTFMTGLVYLFEIFPDNVTEFIDIFNSNYLKDEKMFFKLLLGRAIFNDSYSVGKITTDMDEHIEILKYYLDSILIERLAEVDTEVEDFFDLLEVIMDKYNDWLMDTKDFTSNMYNRYYDILYYLTYDINTGFNTIFLNFNRKAHASGKPLTTNEVTSIFNNRKGVTPKTLFNIVRGGGNLCLMPVDYPGDNFVSKLTSITEDQGRGDGVIKSSNNPFPHQLKKIAGPHLIAGTYLYLPKKCPSPVVRGNHYVKIDMNTGRLKPDEELEIKTTVLDMKLQGKLGEDEVDKVSLFKTEDVKDS